MCTYALTERGDKQPTILSYGNTDDFIVWQYGRFHRMALRSVSHILKDIETGNIYYFCSLHGRCA